MNTQVKIKAYHLKKSIDLKSIDQLINIKPISASTHDLFISTEENRYLYIVNYGAIVFYNYDSSGINKVLNLLKNHNAADINNVLTDDFEIIENKESYVEVKFDHITVRNIDAETIKIVMLNFAQSIALSYYDNISQQLISQVRLFTTEMEQKGKLKISKNNILKFIGKALNTQNKIIENLYIFDAPSITWENEYYKTVNTTLSRHLELNERYRSIENTFKVIDANLHAFLDLNHQRESSKLEWIIIILILVEVIDTFVMKVL